MTRALAAIDLSQQLQLGEFWRASPASPGSSDRTRVRAVITAAAPRRGATYARGAAATGSGAVHVTPARSTLRGGQTPAIGH
jgi:hypothetical protein